METGSIIIGKNAVIEAIRAGIKIDKVYLVKGEADSAHKHIASAAKTSGAVVIETDRRKLDQICKNYLQTDDSPAYGEFVHQGVVALAAAVEYITIDRLLGKAAEKGHKPLIIICDEISDPHNLGAIIRTAEAAGADGVIIPKRRNAGLSPTVIKASSGAVFHIDIVRVTNITAAIRELKEKNVWVFGAAADGETTLWETDFTGSTAIVIGSEGKGISRLVRENCDVTVNIPMDSNLSSLNASVSAAVLLYEAYRQRKQTKTNK